MKRTIAAILAADVVGYSRLIAEDEEGTIRRLAEHGDVFRSFVQDHGGRVFNTAGDSILAEFPSAVEAMRAAIAIQEALLGRNRELEPARRLAYRMGMTIGDVVEVKGDLLGDGVNIAARLEGIAEPGGICVARSIHEAVSNKVSVSFRDLGPQRLKNIPRPVHAFRVVWPDADIDAGLRVRLRGAVSRRPIISLTLTGLPLIVVAVLWVALAGYWQGRGDAFPQEEGADGDPDALPVSVVKAVGACFKDQVRLSGVIVPHKDVDVRPEDDGFSIVSLDAAPLVTVTAGQTLAYLSKSSGAKRTVVTLRSPVAGIVGRSSAQPGTVISATSPAPFQIIAEGVYELAAEASLSALARLSPGQRAWVTPLGTGELKGRVRTVSETADPVSQTGRVRIQLTEEGDVRQGTFASAVVDIAERCGIGVPLSAVMIGDEGRFVYVLDSGRLAARPVVTGLTADDMIEVQSGLGRQETVVARAGAFLREGATIKPVSE
ncbi:HlyD family efflux transporter periplasmic adaptor subunit [Methylobacterium sp. Leaf93]|uniref:HlyD family efflux transporter periplasmic adaptor subunit n=1 Tax=Methylobacterium sp. Leaf93 TaxID=1736249 RepID=UPI0006F29C94|nr:HlyD family efflux transporter periplasmic adaptor subunit [Methylobacterium sp. Leaf93]KQP00978.1 hypothetical protein ASF26_15535 [Methylobacterium sp. Leaf93]